MKSIILISFLLILAGCNSSRSIQVVDERGIPIKDCLIVARERSMVPVSIVRTISKTNSNGDATFNLFDVVCYTAVKNGFLPSTINTNGDAKIVLSKNDFGSYIYDVEIDYHSIILKDRIRADKTKRIESDYWQEWFEYLKWLESTGYFKIDHPFKVSTQSP